MASPERYKNKYGFFGHIVESSKFMLEQVQVRPYVSSLDLHSLLLYTCALVFLYKKV